jgi:HEAT repeat protein
VIRVASQPLLEAVTNRPRVSRAACIALGRIKPNGAATTLLPFLDSSDEGLTWRISLALRELADPSALEALVRAFGKTQDRYLKGDLAAAIAAIGGPSAVSMLIPMLHDNAVATPIRKKIAIGFGYSRDPTVLHELIAVYRRYPESPHYDEAEVCEECLRSIGRYGAPETVDLLSGELLRPHSHRTTAIAADGLITIGTPAVPALLKLLTEADDPQEVPYYRKEDLVWGTVRALVGISARIGGDEAIRAVLAYVTSHTDRANYPAVDGIRRLLRNNPAIVGDLALEMLAVLQDVRQEIQINRLINLT